MMQGARKYGLLLRLAFTRPQEFLDRISSKADALRSRGETPHSTGVPQEEGLRRFSDWLGADLGRLVLEPEAARLKAHIEAQKAKVKRPLSGIPHDADFGLAELCYAVCRAIKPELALETGVSNGVTTAFILQALEINQTGALWSFDLPSLGVEDEVGSFVPPELKKRWRLIYGRTRRTLPRELAHAGPVDFFLHDSLHTARNMRFEFAAAWPHLRAGGVLMSDDVHRNLAFQDFVATRTSVQAVIWPSIGIAVKPS